MEQVQKDSALCSNFNLKHTMMFWLKAFMDLQEEPERCLSWRCETFWLCCMQGEGWQCGGDTGKTAQLNKLSCGRKINVMSLCYFTFYITSIYCR